MESKFEKWLNGNTVVLSGIMGLSFLAAGASTIITTLSGKAGTGFWMNVYFLFGLACLFLGSDALCQVFTSYKSETVSSTKGRSKNTP